VIIVNAGTGETTARFVSRAALMAASVEPEGRRIVITTRTGDVVLLCLENLEFDRREFLKLHARGVKPA